jgi:hypothetical protein
VTSASLTKRHQLLQVMHCEAHITSCSQVRSNLNDKQCIRSSGLNLEVHVCNILLRRYGALFDL